jgi:hypothetical protein
MVEEDFAMDGCFLLAIWYWIIYTSRRQLRPASDSCCSAKIRPRRTRRADCTETVIYGGSGFRYGWLFFVDRGERPVLDNLQIHLVFV